MKLTKEQQKELKKINSSFSELSGMIGDNNRNFSDLFKSEYYYNEVSLSDLEHQKVISKNRQQVFEQSRSSKKKIKASVN